MVRQIGAVAIIIVGIFGVEHDGLSFMQAWPSSTDFRLGFCVEIIDDRQYIVWASDSDILEKL